MRKSKIPIGLDIGSGMLKVAQVKEKKGRYELEIFDMLPLPPELIVDGSIMDSIRVSDFIKELLRKAKIKIKDVVISVTGHASVIVKRISLSEMSEEELSEMSEEEVEKLIKFEAEQIIPWPIDDVSLDFQVLGLSEEPGQMDVILVAVKNEVINEYISVVKEAGLNPIVVDVDIFAIENLYEVNYEIEPYKTVGIIDIGASSIKMDILKGGLPSFTRETPIGTNILTEALQREFNLSYEVAERLLKGEAVEGVEDSAAEKVVTETLEEIILEISRSVDHYKTFMAGEEISELIISGGGALVRGLQNNLSEKVGIDVSILDPFQNISISKKLDEIYIREMAPIAAVSIGLALRRIADR